MGGLNPLEMKENQKNIEAYENMEGYGFEEWLFDTSKQIDGYCYGYVRSIAAKNDFSEFVSGKLNLHLYTIENESRFNQRYWVGEIKEVEFIDEEEAKRINQIYKANGWNKKMQNQLKDVGINISSADISKMFFCMKYKVENLFLEKELIPFERSDEIVKADYYNNLYRFISIYKKTRKRVYLWRAK